MRREGGQVRAAEAGRRGSVGHVEVFRMDGVGTSIVGRPRRLSADRRARPTYTLIWEEPDWIAPQMTWKAAIRRPPGRCARPARI
ncbi:hypothetical protein EXY26_14195 [Glutamicibacter arilaitensis]|uniref:Uncharacterized protein n=1 Tax=Glutamicibacter arilaitensis TaxID=256701 RepID=A0A4Y8TVQ7_9MICC|nr:hypothetical protein EXY26_14195 [Glutamicibacter arilaitensis]